MLRSTDRSTFALAYLHPDMHPYFSSGARKEHILRAGDPS